MLPEPPLRGVVIQGDNLAVAESLPDGIADLIYLDPPFNTGQRQERRTLRVERTEDGDRIGFGGRRYRSEEVGRIAYADRFDDYLAFLEPRLRAAHRLLADSGALYFHGDYREIHYCKVLIDGIFGRANFLNEIIWSYDYGGRPRDRWPAKHDTILYYARERGRHLFNREAIDRLPYLAPSLVGPAKAAAGKLPTDSWWLTIVSPTGREKTGYPTQKPVALLRRMIVASSPPDGLIVDLFAGSGTTGAAAIDSGRRFLLVDEHPDAIRVMRRRFAEVPVGFVS